MFSFLYFQGCTRSCHTNVKPPEPEKTNTDDKPLGLDEVSFIKLALNLFRQPELIDYKISFSPKVKRLISLITCLLYNFLMTSESLIW